MLDYNTTNLLDLPSDNNKEYISSVTSNIGKERIRSADINNKEEDIKPTDISKKKPVTPYWTPQNKLLSELSSSFREVVFGEFKFLAGTPVLDTRYEHAES